MTDIREQIAEIVQEAIHAGFADAQCDLAVAPDPPAEHYADRILAILNQEEQEPVAWETLRRVNGGEWKRFAVGERAPSMPLWPEYETYADAGVAWSNSQRPLYAHPTETPNAHIESQAAEIVRLREALEGGTDD